MDRTIVRHIVLGIYKHCNNPDIQASYKSNKVWVKTKGKWKEYTFVEMVNTFQPHNHYLLNLAGAMK